MSKKNDSDIKCPKKVVITAKSEDIEILRYEIREPSKSIYLEVIKSIRYDTLKHIKVEIEVFHNEISNEKQWFEITHAGGEIMQTINGKSVIQKTGKAGFEDVFAVTVAQMEF